MGAQHREDHLRNRQGTYHNLITADQNLQNALGHGIGDPNAALDEFRHLGNGAVLFGSAAVKDAVRFLLAQYVVVVREAQEIAGDKPMSPADIRMTGRGRACPGWCSLSVPFGSGWAFAGPRVSLGEGSQRL